MAPAMCVIPAYDTGDWLRKGLSASVVHRISALAQRSLSVIQVSSAFLAGSCYCQVSMLAQIPMPCASVK